MVTLDRQSQNHALLTLANGAQYDVYGNSWLEMKDEANEIAASLGVIVDVFNSECPE